MLQDRQKIGIGLSAFGVLFTFLGLIFFFDRGLLAMGNIAVSIAHALSNPMHPRKSYMLMFLSGVAMTIGPRATLRFFSRRKNWKGSGFFLTGVLVVLYGWAVVGMLVETYGFWVLFSDFFPIALGKLRTFPVLGRALDLPVLKTVINKIAPAQSQSLPI